MAYVQYEPMFVHMKKLPAKTADVLDLIIEFATLGEYGLEYPDRPAGQSPRPCEKRTSRSRTVAGASSLRAGVLRQDSRDTCSSETSDFASALRPPRIKLSFTE